VNLGWHRDRKENPISAPSIPVGALVGAGSLWPNIWTGVGGVNGESAHKSCSCMHELYIREHEDRMLQFSR
jgi:hypothetical protein